MPENLFNPATHSPNFTTLCPNFAYEQQYAGVICGVDEVGRGAWAGPVVACALIWTATTLHITMGIKDSKLLSPQRRRQIANSINKTAIFAIGIASPAEIDKYNILQANFLAMQRAVSALPLKPDHALIDGNRAPILDCPVTCLVKGDNLSVSIAAASIIAKTYRDRLMCAYALLYPGYGFERHVGYGTEQHRQALKQIRPSPIHRMSFAPVAAR